MSRRGYPSVPTHRLRILSPKEKAELRKKKLEAEQKERHRQLEETAKREARYRKQTQKLRDREYQEHKEELERKARQAEYRQVIQERERKREKIHRLLREEGWHQEGASTTPGFDRFEKWVKEGESLFLPPVDDLSLVMELRRDLAANESDRRSSMYRHYRWESWVDADDKRFPAGKGRVRELWYNPEDDEHFLVDAVTFDDREPNPYREGENFWRVPRRGGRHHKTVRRRKGGKRKQKKRRTQKKRKTQKRKTRRRRR